METIVQRLGRWGLGAGLVAMLCVPGAPVRADAAVGKTRAEILRGQLRVLDTRAATQYAHSSRLRPQGAEVVPRYTGAYRGVHLGPAREAARRHRVPEDLFLRLVAHESGWNPEAVSTKGALGLAQLMPETARGLGVNPSDPRDNLEGGARYLRAQYERFGSWRLALAAYNAGPEAVARHGGVPPFRETRAYVAAILGAPIRLD